MSRPIFGTLNSISLPCVLLDVTPAAGWKIVGWSDDQHFDGDHRDIDVYEDLDLVVYLEEIEPEGD